MTKKTKKKITKKINKVKTKKQISNSNLKILKLLIPLAIILIAIIIAGMSIWYISSGKTVAKVNGVSITEKQLDKQYDFMFFLSGYPDEFKSIMTKELFLSQLINEELLLQEAEKHGKRISKEEVSLSVRKFIEGNDITEEEMKSKLSEAGFSMGDISDYYKRQLTILSFVNDTVFNGINISSNDSEEYYTEHLEEFKAEKGQIRASHILVDTKDEAEEILYLLNNGADFSELAKEKSKCPSSVSGGELGFIKMGQMVKEFEEAAFALKVGETSEPVETEFGWHLIFRLPNQIYFSEAEDSIKSNLLEQRRQARLEEYFEELRKSSRIELFIDIEKNKKTISLIDNSTEEKDNSTQEHGEQSLTENCFEDYSIGPDTLIFYHSDYCSHCNSMKPIVHSLESEDYNFLWVEVNSGKNIDVVSKCFTDVLQGAVPEFICAGTKDFKLGSMSKEKLESFAKKCKT